MQFKPYLRFDDSSCTYRWIVTNDVSAISLFWSVAFDVSWIWVRRLLLQTGCICIPLFQNRCWWDELNTDLADWADAMRVGCYDKNRIKTPCGGILSCFEYLMVNVSDALTWMRFTTCIRDIYHQVSDDTLSHRAINRIKTVMQGVGAMWLVELNTDLADLTDAMHVGCYDKNRIKTPCGHTLMLRVSDG